MTKLGNKVLISWSTGKDSTYALYKLKQLKNKFEIIGLFTTFSEISNSTNTHGIRRKLLEEQASQMDLPLYVVETPHPCPNEAYEARIKTFLAAQFTTGVSYVTFGDIFLKDIRHYRELQLATTSIQPLFPLWHQDTKSLAHEIIDAGFKAIITCINPKKLDISFAGREFDNNFLKDLSSGVDPCGENGEFHTFVYDSPLFSKPINISRGKIVKRNGFIFAGLDIAK